VDSMPRLILPGAARPRRLRDEAVTLRLLLGALELSHGKALALKHQLAVTWRPRLVWRLDPTHQHALALVGRERTRCRRPGSGSG
jgi:hypothetical protein